MFKEENQIWLYLLGILIMFIILTLSTSNVLIPVFYTEGDNSAIDLTATRNNPPAFTIDINKNYLANIQTNLGSLTVDLFEQNAPENVNSFIYLSSKKYYNGILFHRYEPGKILQGGDRNTLDSNPDNDGKGNAGYVIDDEINLGSLPLTESRVKELKDKGYGSANGTLLVSKSVTEYSLVMANDGPDTNGSQFFIVLEDAQEIRNEFTGKFTVIGKVVNPNALNSLKNIDVTFDENLKINRPNSDIIINSIEIFTSP